MVNTIEYEEDFIHEFTKTIARHAFEFLNGRINKVVRARHLVFTMERAVDVGTNFIIVGSSMYGIITMNTDFLLECNRLNIRKGSAPLSADSATMMIVGHIAHELSHCDQKLSLNVNPDKSVFIDEELTTVLINEIANELRTVKWLTEHEKEIQKEFGIKSKATQYSTNSVYLKKNEELGNPITIQNWIPYNNVFEAFIRALGDIIGLKDGNKVEKFIEYLKSKGIRNFALVHNINLKNAYEYNFGDFERIKNSEYLSNAMLDILIDEILIHTPSFMTYMEIEKHKATFYVLKSKTRPKKDFSGVPDNVSTGFYSIHALPSDLDKKIRKFFHPNTTLIELDEIA